MAGYNLRLVNEYLEYYRNSYGSDFRPNQGLDEITDLIQTYSVDGSWIDLGGGTSTNIWLPAFHNISEITVVDLHKEAFYVQNLVKKEPPSGCYQHVLNRYHKSSKELNAIPIKFIEDNLLENVVISARYNNVTQFGLLGLCKSVGHYYRQLDQLSQYVESGGVFMGANWVLSDYFQKEREIYNSYLKDCIIQRWTISRGKSLLYERLIPIENDPNYDFVLIYAFK